MDCHAIINVISVPYKHAGILHVCYYIVLLCHMDGNVLVIKLSVSLRFMRLEPLISHTGILMTFYLSIILDLQNFFL